jgi:hypothetical protein
MPIVTLTGWQPGQTPSSPPEPLLKLLRTKAGMDSDDAIAAVRRLMKGKSVDAVFDLGENRAANAFVGTVREFGLEAELHDDVRESWFGSPPRPHFLKWALGGLLAFFLWFGLFQLWPQGWITRVVGAILLGYALLPLLFGRILGKRHITEQQEERERAQALWWRIAIYGVVALIAAIISEPWIGIILLALALCAAAFACVIHVINRNA